LAIYHFSIKIISRGHGKSAVASAAYRAGEKITNEFDGKVHDYTKKHGVVFTQILLPDNAPREYTDRAVLWNAVEKIEKASNAQLARELELALPAELTQSQNVFLVREYINRHFVSAGMCADVCVHDKGDGNPHAHVMLTMRPFEPDGSWGAKAHKVNGKKVCTVDWNDRDKAEQWRAAWAEAVNAALEKASVSQRVDHRSYSRQGIEQVPTIHLGVAASQMERKGIHTDRGDINRNIDITNQQLRQLRARIKKAKTWLYAQPLTNAPTLLDMMHGLAGGQNLDAQWKKIADLKTRAKVLVFLGQNHITDVGQLAEKVERMHRQQYDLAGRIKAVERRFGTLGKHLAQYENYKQHKAIFQKYQQLAPKKRDAFCEKHSEEIQLYQNAKQYLDGVMNGRTTIPIKAWLAERDKLSAEKFTLSDKYYRLKEEVRAVEVLRRGAENIMGANAPERAPARERGLER